MTLEMLSELNDVQIAIILFGMDRFEEVLVASYWSNEFNEGFDEMYDAIETEYIQRGLGMNRWHLKSMEVDMRLEES